MTAGLIQAAQLLLMLSILVLVHEWGHYIAARIFKTRVEKFYLFFDWGFSLFKFKKGETEYGIGWLPLGGYVKISGMIDESMDTEQMKQPAQPWEFRSKPAWQRLIIMLGGITMNIILGIFIYAMFLFAYGEEYVPNANLKYGIAVDSTAMKLGFQRGDKIISVDGKPIEKYNDVLSGIIFNDAKKVEVNRNGENKVISIDEDAIKKIVDSQSPDFISPRVPFVIKEFGDDSPAKKAGMKEGDEIIAMDGKPMFFYDEAAPYLLSHKSQTIKISILRGADTVLVPVTISEAGLLGVNRKTEFDFFTTKTITYGFFASFPAGVNKAASTLTKYVKQFKLIFSSKIQGYKHVGGFISMAKIMSPKWDWTWFWDKAALFSIILAFMNFLPIPALDGGHVLFTLYEIVVRRKPNEKFLEYAQIAGIVFLISLMLLANGNDVIKLFR